MPEPTEKIVGMALLNWSCECGKRAEYKVRYTFIHSHLGQLERMRTFCEEHLPDEARRWWNEELTSYHTRQP